MIDYKTKKNERGETLDEFLKKYDADKYKHPSTTVDMVVATVQNGELKVLLVKRRDHPFIGCWATPGGFIGFGEDIDHAAMRELYEETGMKDRVYFHQLYTFGKANRDPRTHVTTTAYLTLVPSEVIEQTAAGDDAADAKWFTVRQSVEEETEYERVTKLVLSCDDEVITYRITEKVTENWVKFVSELVEDESTNQLAADHVKIVNMAINEIKEHAFSGGLIFNMMPKEFSLTELMNTYEAISGKKFPRRAQSNFARDVKKYVLPSGNVRPYGKKRMITLYKANRLYRNTDF